MLATEAVAEVLGPAKADWEKKASSDDVSAMFASALAPKQDETGDFAGVEIENRVEIKPVEISIPEMSRDGKIDMKFN